MFILHRLLSIAAVMGITAALAVGQTNPPAANPNSASWKKIGGQMILSGKFELKTSWATGGEYFGKKLYWKAGTPPKDRKYQPWDPTIANEVAPKMGTVTIQPPGTLVLYSKSEGAYITVHIQNSKTRMPVSECKVGKYGKIWRTMTPGIKPRGTDKSQFTYGRLMPGEPMAFDVFANSNAYNNLSNSGEFIYYAPQSVEFELWFFPEMAGHLIKATKYDKDGQEVDVTPENPDKDKQDQDDVTIEPVGLDEPKQSSLVGGQVMTGEVDTPIKNPIKDKLDMGYDWKTIRRDQLAEEIIEYAKENNAEVRYAKLMGWCKNAAEPVAKVGETVNYGISFYADIDPTGVAKVWAMPLDLAYTWAASRRERYENNGDISMFSMDDLPSVVLKAGENVAFSKLQKMTGFSPFSRANTDMKYMKIMADKFYVDQTIAEAKFASEKKTQVSPSSCVPQNVDFKHYKK